MKKMSAAATTLSAPSPMNSARQPNGPSSASTGTVADSEPTLPIPIIQPLSAVSRSRGNHSVNALIDPIRPADTPSPISARPAESIARSRARPKISAPAAATQKSAAVQRRGPKRSSSTPRGSWASANERKYTLVSRPRSEGARPKSDTRSLAITALT
jgi:hypothetical protein